MSYRIMCIAAIMIFVCSGSSFAGWKQEGSSWKYQNADGTYVRGKWATINDEYYYFDDDGYMLSGTTTPDGYVVDNNGKWVVDDIVQKDQTFNYFKSGYQFGDFNRFNSYAGLNGLKNTPIWIEGGYTETTTLSSIARPIWTKFIDTDSNAWLVFLDADALTDIEKFDQYKGHNLCVVGIYSGYSNKYSMPVIYMAKLYDKQTGAVTSSRLLKHSDMASYLQQGNNDL